MNFSLGKYSKVILAVAALVFAFAKARGFEVPEETQTAVTDLITIIVGGGLVYQVTNKGANT